MYKYRQTGLQAISHDNCVVDKDLDRYINICLNQTQFGSLNFTSMRHHQCFLGDWIARCNFIISHCFWLFSSSLMLFPSFNVTFNGKLFRMILTEPQSIVLFTELWTLYVMGLKIIMFNICKLFKDKNICSNEILFCTNLHQKVLSSHLTYRISLCWTVAQWQQRQGKTSCRRQKPWADPGSSGRPLALTDWCDGVI